MAGAAFRTAFRRAMGASSRRCHQRPPVTTTISPQDPLGHRHHPLLSLRHPGSLGPKKKLAPGTLKRTLKFGAPYAPLLSELLAVVIVEAAVGAASPLLVGQEGSYR